MDSIEKMLGSLAALGCEPLFRRFGRICFFCGTSAERTHFTRDHLWPLCRGGLDVMVNLVPACSDCNSRKGDRRPTQEEMDRHASYWTGPCTLQGEGWEQVEEAYQQRTSARLWDDQINSHEAKLLRQKTRKERKAARQQPVTRNAASWIPRHLRQQAKARRMPPPTPEQIEAAKKAYMAGTWRV